MRLRAALQRERQRKRLQTDKQYALGDIILADAIRRLIVL